MDPTITTLGIRLTASYRWCTVSPGASRGMPDSLHQRLWPFISTRGFLGTVWWLSSRGASHRVFRSTLQGLINR
jgi:hypothetical protein